MTPDLTPARITLAADQGPGQQRPPSLDPATVAAVTDLLRAAGQLARAQAPIVLHTPAPAPAPHPGISVTIPTAPTSSEQQQYRPGRRTYTRPEASLIASTTATVAAVAGVAATGSHTLAALALSSALGILASGIAIVTSEGHR